jgi:hypothetical protein
MRGLSCCILLLAAHPALADPDDAAHRADRARTRQLNNQAAAVVGRRDARDRDTLSSYRTAQARYARQLAQWRQRVADCEDGYWRACDNR